MNFLNAFLSAVAALFSPGQKGVDYGVTFGPYLGNSTMTKVEIDQLALQKAEQLVRAEEGYRLDVYLDTEGYKTVGIGHKVTLLDNLSLGQRITAEQAVAFFRKDLSKAFDAGRAQALQLGKYNPDMIAALTSASFQLGAAWTAKFHNTWPKLLRGDWEGAVRGFSTSKWARQTPDRVAVLTEAIKKNYDA